jgi:hypothetical protein
MFEIIWAVWVIPKVIFPAAKASGRNGILWVFYSIIIFFSTEAFILISYFAIYPFISNTFQLTQKAERFWGIYLTYFIALISGLLIIDRIRRYLGDSKKVYKPLQ